MLLLLLLLLLKFIKNFLPPSFILSQLWMVRLWEGEEEEKEEEKVGCEREERFTFTWMDNSDLSGPFCHCSGTDWCFLFYMEVVIWQFWHCPGTNWLFSFLPLTFHTMTCACASSSLLLLPHPTACPKSFSHGRSAMYANVDLTCDQAYLWQPAIFDPSFHRLFWSFATGRTHCTQFWKECFCFYHIQFSSKCYILYTCRPSQLGSWNLQLHVYNRTLNLL